MEYKLLTPGPLTTTATVKQEMLVDHCTWDNEYKQITQHIRKELLGLAIVTEKKYTAVLMQGSGTFGVEAVLSSAIGENDELLIVVNGAYGERMVEIAKANKIKHIVYRQDYDKVPDAYTIKGILVENPQITHVAMVHCETTSGILNDIESIANVVKAEEKTFIVDAMSSFGGIEIHVEKLGIDFLISSANKCIQGVPGFTFIIANREALKKCEGRAKSLSLDLYAQWVEMEKDGKWRFTSPTHVVLAFNKALEELKAEGGITKRNARYVENNKLLIKKFDELGIKTYIGGEHQSPIITTFFVPRVKNYSFEEMYDYIKERGYAIYPGKVTDADTFRIGNIGEIYKEDILRLSDILAEYLRRKEDE